MRKKKPKKESHTLDKYIVFCLGFITIYTIVHTIIFYLTGQEAKTLDRLVIGVLFSEILMCFLIKRFKLHEEAKIVLGKKQSKDTVDDDGFIDLDEDE